MPNDDFIKEAKQARNQFVKALQFLPWNNQVRTKSESLMIMFDQMTEFISLSDKKI